MTDERRPARPGPGRRLGLELRERASVAPLELFFDLVFVLCFTQCTALMAAQPTWAGIGRGMLVLAVIWWAWVLYAWLTNVIEPEEGVVRIVMFLAMTGLLVVALSIPEAFGDRALAFALAYGIVRVANVALYLTATRDETGLRRSVVGFALSTLFAVALLVGASFLAGAVQATVWVLVVLLDWGAAAVLGDTRLRIVPAHFAERHNLVIILALGESVVALGAGADVDFSAAVLTAAALGIWLAAALWWLYFDVVALVTERRLLRASEGRARTAMARDTYSYLHFPMVAGIVLAALGLEETLHHVEDPLDAVHAFALLGGTAIYLAAHVAIRLRNARTINVERLALSLLLLAAIPLAVHIDALATLAALVVVLWLMIGYETFFVYDERRYRLRHGLEIDIPGPG